MPFSIGAHIDTSEVQTKLRYAKEKVAGKALKKGVGRGSTRILNSAKARAPVDTTSHGVTEKGLYKKSLGKKVKAYRNGMTVVAVIGPRLGFKRPMGIRKRGKHKGEAFYQDPANIAHLVEYGHGGPAPAPAYPHLRPAVDCNKEAVMEDIAEAVREEIF
jgi:hypothetical protein